MREARLQHGDLLSLGGSTFLVSLAAPEPEPPRPSEELPLDAETEILLPIADSVYLSPDRLAGAGGASAPLAALLRLAAAVQERPEPAALGRELLRQALAALPADRAALLPPEPDPDAFVPLWEHAGAGGSGPFAVSRSVLARALAGRAALLWSGVREPAPADSVLASGIGALICAPLAGADGPLALLYLDVQAPGHLDQEHLELSAAMAALTSGAFANALHREALARENRRLQEAALGSGLLGESAAMRRAAEVLAKVAPTPSTVLLLGESGTGKELAARAIHLGSPRAAGRSWPSTAPRSPRRCSRASCSATRGAPSPARWRRSPASSSWRTAARSSSTRSASCRCPPRRSCCASSRSGPSSGSAARGRSRWTSASWRPPTATSRRGSPRAASAPTSTTASTWSR